MFQAGGRLRRRRLVRTWSLHTSAKRFSGYYSLKVTLKKLVRKDHFQRQKQICLLTLGMKILVCFLFVSEQK